MSSSTGSPLAKSGPSEPCSPRAPSPPPPARPTSVKAPCAAGSARTTTSKTNRASYREEALSHAALMLQQGAATAVAIMYELIQSGRPIEPGRVLLIRTAIEYAFRSAIYCDIIERVKTLEKAQRLRLGNRTPPAPPATASRSRLGAPNQGTTTFSKERTSNSNQGTSQDPHPPRANFPRSAHHYSRPAVKPGWNFRKSAHNGSLRTAETPGFAPHASGAWSRSRARKQAVSPKPAPNRPSLKRLAPWPVRR